MQFLALILSLISISMILDIRKRLEKLEKLQSKPNPLPEPIPSKKVNNAEELKPAPAKTSTVGNRATSTQVDPFSQFIKWFQDDWLLKIGILILLIGFGWFVSYAFLNNWIGPVGRVTLGFVAGILVTLLGWTRIKKYLHQGSAFLVFGSTLILITVFAGREAYGFFDPFTAHATMLLSTAFIALASVKYKNVTLGLVNILLAGIVPLLVRTPITSYVGLFTYLLVVVVGALWIVTYMKERVLVTAALLMVFMHSLRVIGLSFDIRAMLIIFGYLFTSIFFVAGLAGILKSNSKEPNSWDIVTTTLNGIFLLFWVAGGAAKEWQSLIIVAWSLVYIFGAYILLKLSQSKQYFYVFSSVGIFYIAAATALELKGAELSLAYIVEAGIITVLSWLIFKKPRLTENVSTVFAIPVFMSFSSMVGFSRSRGFFQQDLYVLITMALVLLWLGYYFFKNDYLNLKHLTRIFISVGSLYLYISTWDILHIILKNRDAAVTVVLLIYTVVGLTTYFKGVFRDSKFSLNYGTVLLGFVCLRLLLIDVWNMDLTERIIAFFLIGSLFVSTAFITAKRSKNEIKTL